MTGRKTLLEAYRERPYRNIFSALLVVTLVDALAPGAVARGRFSDLMLVVILTAALVETARSRRNTIWALALGLPAILLRLANAFTEDSPVLNTTTLTVTAIFFAFLIWNLLHDLGKGDRPTSERVFGALCAYVFIGLFFALVYTHMEYRRTGTFAISEAVAAEDGEHESNLLPIFTYYSFVTLTTLGYGDVSPIVEHARTLAWLEALLGQLYLAVMVAGLVAIHISESMKKDRDGPPPPG